MTVIYTIIKHRKNLIVCLSVFLASAPKVLDRFGRNWIYMYVRVYSSSPGDGYRII